MEDKLRNQIDQLIDRHMINGELTSWTKLRNGIIDTINQERRAAAEAMRERCATVAEMCASTPPYDGIDETALYIARSIRRLPLDERNG